MPGQRKMYPKGEPTLVVMVKEPRPGRVKTRLGHEIGMVAAAWWFRHQTGSLLRRVRDPRWRVVLAVSPDREGLSSRVWPAELLKRPQGRGDLGDRMRRQFKLSGQGPVCIIGADIPGVERRHIATAFRALGSADAVFGPAPDGGYWLVGLRNPTLATPAAFSSVRWSSKHALADTLASIPGYGTTLIDTLRDVDRAADLLA